MEKLFEKNGVTVSMSRKGSLWGNAK